MAVARLVCGDCGGELAPSDIRCPACGASIERETGTEMRSAAPPAAAPGTPQACAACGEINAAGAEVCASCGARMNAPSPPVRKIAAGTAARQWPARRAKAGRPPARERPRSGRRLDPWQVISIVAVLGLVSYGIYLKVTAEQAPAGASGSQEPSQGSDAAGAFGAAKPDLTPLEDAVRQNPADAEANLRLADALSDTKSYARAVGAYRAYLALRPRDPDARTDMGICYFQEALTDSMHRDSLLHNAAAEMRRAFDTAPKPHQPSAYNLGVVYIHLNEIAEANRWFRKAYEIDKTSELGKRAQSMIAQTIIPQ